MVYLENAFQFFVNTAICRLCYTENAAISRDYTANILINTDVKIAHPRLGEGMNRR